MNSRGRSTVLQYVLAILIFSFAGTAAELVLTKHYDTPWKVVPIVLFGVALLVLAAARLRPGSGTIRVFGGIMVLFVISGVVGAVLHYQGKAEFALERNKSLSGLALLRETVLKGSNPPLLAPGAMIALGLLGLVWAYGAAERYTSNTSGEKT